MQTLFKYGMGEKIMKAVYDTKDYPDTAVIRESICLDYQLKGHCYKEETCSHAKSHFFIPNNVFKKFIYWAREVIRKNKLDDGPKDSGRELIKKKKPDPKPEQKLEEAVDSESKE